MYDELAHLIWEEDVDERLELWVKENMTTDFTEFYVIGSEDADEDIAAAKNNGYRKLEPERKMGLDEVSWPDISRFALAYVGCLCRARLQSRCLIYFATSWIPARKSTSSCPCAPSSTY